MRVLIVEDETKLARNIKKVLQEEAMYAVDIACEGSDGCHLALSNPYDLVILDLMLPKINGLEILKQVRHKGIKTPVLILTAMDAADDIIKGLDMGCDDYLTKPFDMKILLARCRALIRRGFDQPTPQIRVNNLVIDPVTQKAFYHERQIVLSVMEYRLLEYLARRQGQIVSKTEIEEHLYDFGSEKFSNVVEVYISTLRKKLGGGHEIIHTLRNRGYVLGEKA